MAARSELDVVVQGKDDLTPTLDQLQSRLIRFVGFVSSALTAVKIAGFPVGAIRSFEKELANVQKTTGFTDNQIKQLSDSLVKMSRNINVSADDLGKIAAAAGQQGLGREGVDGVRQFTESVSRMASVLDVTVEEAGSNIGKIASIFKIPLREIESAVSGFNEVANNSTATGEQLLDVVKRIGDAAGSLNLEQSIGLSATGIDLGLSPEVVGSSFQKVFAEMYGRAEGFSKLLNVSVSDWMTTVQNNGIDALKMYLDGLRKLTPEAQQQTIKTLSGGGRIGALVTKLLRDTEDTILDRNVENATRGITTGTSAIKEQQTVLKTLDAEIIKAKNSFTALGIAAGEQFGPKLAGYFAQINEALAGEGIQQFAEAVGKTFLDLIDGVATLTKFIAGLNVNWQNFITVAKVFAGLKLVQVFSGMLSQVPGLSTAWQKLAGSATAAGEAQVAAGGAGTSVLSAQITRVKELIAQHQAYQQALKEEAAFKAQVAQNEKRLQAAEIARENARGKENQGRVAIVQAGTAITTAKAGVSGAEQAAAAARLQVQQATNTRLERAASEHAAKMAAIEQERTRLQSIARAAGDRSALLAATRARNEQLAVEEASYARSIKQINAYYARRLQTVEAASAAEVAAQRLALMQSMSQFDGVVADTGMTQLAANSRTAATAVAAANANLQASTVSLTLAQRAALAASAGYSALATGVRVAAAAMQGFIAVAGRIFFWFTMIYSVLSALGVLDKLGGWFDKLTDRIGWTSEASRKLTEQERARARAHEEAARAAQEAAAGLEKLIDAQTGLISDKDKTRFALGLTDEDRDNYMKTLNEVVAATAGAEAKLQTLGEAKIQIPIDVDKLKKEREEAVRVLAGLQTDLDTLKTRFGYTAALGDFSAQLVIRQAQEAVDGQSQAVAQLQRRLDSYSQDVERNISTSIDKTKTNLADLQEIIASTFTPESADVFSKFFPEYVKGMEASKQALADLDTAQKAYSQARGTDQEEARKAEVASAQAMYEGIRVGQESLTQAMGATIAQLKAQGGLSGAAIGSLDSLKIFFNYTTEQLNALLNGIVAINNAGGKFTGSAVAPVTKPDQGEGTNTSETKAEARRRRKAELDLTKAKLAAEAALLKEANAQQNDTNEDNYKQNLASINDYYARRLALQRKNMAIEMRLRQQELAALNSELGSAEEGSEKLRIQAQIVKAQADVDLLKVQRSALATDNARAMRDALREFSDRVVEQRRALVDYFGAGSDQVAFTTSLDAANAKYKDFIDRLTAESARMPELIPVIDTIKMQAQFEAVEDALDQLSRRSAVATGYLDITSQRIAALGQAGILTRGQVSGLEEKNRKAIVKVKEAENQRSLALLAQLGAQNNGLGAQTLKYQELQLEISKRAQEIEALKVQGNEVANQINSDLKNSVKEGLLAVTTPGADFATVFTDFLISIVNSLRDVAAEGLADIFMQSIKSTAGEGFGGFFSDLFGSSAKTIDSVSVGSSTLGNLSGDALGGLGDVRGSSPALPLFVQNATDALGLGAAGDTSLLGSATKGGLGAAADTGADAAKDAAGAIADKGFLETTFDTLGSTVSEMGSSIMDGLKGMGSFIADNAASGFQQLVSFLGTMVTSIVTAIFSAASSQAASNAGSGLMSAGGGMAMAHTGGIAGRTTMRRTGVNYGIFADAVRHHTGGIAGANSGLAANEVPVILEKGEEILTRDDPRHQENLGSGGDGSGSEATQPIFRVQPVLSEETILDAMKGQQGEKLLLVHISKNPLTFRRALGV